MDTPMTPEDAWGEILGNEAGFYRFDRKLFSVFLDGDLQGKNEKRLNRIHFELLANPNDSDIEGTINIQYGEKSLDLKCEFGSEEMFWMGVAFLQIAKVGGVDRKSIFEMYKRDIDKEMKELGDKSPYKQNYMKHIQEKDLPPIEDDPYDMPKES